MKSIEKQTFARERKSATQVSYIKSDPRRDDCQTKGTKTASEAGEK